MSDVELLLLVNSIILGIGLIGLILYWWKQFKD
jgi:hypothetical protein